MIVVLTSEVLPRGGAAWLPGPALPPQGFLFKACAAAVDPTRLVTVGGGIAYDMVSVYSTATSSWSSWPRLAEGRRGHTCGNLAGRVVVAGGYLFSTHTYTASTLVLDPATGEAAAGGSMVMARAYFSLQQLPAMLLAIGGSTIRSFQDTVEQLEAPDQAWTSTDLALTTGRSTFATVSCGPVESSTSTRITTVEATTMPAPALATEAGCQQSAACRQASGHCSSAASRPGGTVEVAGAPCPGACTCYKHPMGRVLIDSITVATAAGCSDCSVEGVVLTLRGERNIDHRTGLPCTTATLDHLATTDFSEGAARFDGRKGDLADSTEEALMGGCFEVSPSAPITPGAAQRGGGGGAAGLGGGGGVAPSGGLRRLVEQQLPLPVRRVGGGEELLEPGGLPDGHGAGGAQVPPATLGTALGALQGVYP